MLYLVTLAQQHKATSFEIAGAHLHTSAAHHRTNARHQLAWAKGLDHIIIGPIFKSLDHIFICAAHTEHDDWRLAFAANAATDLQTVQLGQIEVKQNQVRLFARPLLQRSFAIICGNGLEAGAAKSKS